MQDTHGNQMTVSYVQWGGGQDIRAAYPEYLRYNNGLVEVRFLSSYDYVNPPGGPSYIRKDNPRGSATPPPRVMEDKRLDSIEVRAGSPLALVRKYNFIYNTTSSIILPTPIIPPTTAASITPESTHSHL